MCGSFTSRSYIGETDVNTKNYWRKKELGISGEPEQSITSTPFRMSRRIRLKYEREAYENEINSQLEGTKGKEDEKHES